MTKFYTLLLLITLLLGSFNNVSSQTSVLGGNVSGTWTLAGSPYLINGSIQIPNGQTLTIEPGVTVNFQGHYKLYVQGRILAIGTETDTITFTASDTTTGWKGIRFDNTPTTNDSSKFFYCKIQFCNSVGTNEEAKGGAFYFRNYSKAIILDCRIYKNSAPTYGGGIYCYSSSPIIKENRIIYNSVLSSNLPCGGGIYCKLSNPSIINNIISYNTASQKGGGIYCENSSPIIRYNTISFNSVNSYDGGGIHCESSFPEISYNSISYNVSIRWGAGISCFTSDPIIMCNVINNNSSSNGGGGINCYDSNPKIIKNYICNNLSVYGGGIECGSHSNSIILNNIITNNQATNGGGTCIYWQSNPIIINCIINNNSANNGGAIYLATNSNPIIKNSIIFGNTATTSGSQVYLFNEDSDPNIYYSNIQGGDAAFGTNDVFYTGTYQNNLDSDPLFVSPTAGSGTSYDGTTADWSLQAGSPCINAGTTDTTGLNLPSTDIAGNPRVSNGRIDIGAYEHLGTSINNPITNNIINIYPNPNNGKFLLYLENYESKNYALEIYDITGQIIYSENYENKTFLAENIVLSQFESGVYFVKVMAGNSNYSKNMVIIK